MHLVAPDGCSSLNPTKKNQGNKHQITYIFTFAKGLLYLRQNMKIGPLPFLQLFFKRPTFPSRERYLNFGVSKKHKFGCQGRRTNENDRQANITKVMFVGPIIIQLPNLLVPNLTAYCCYYYCCHHSQLWQYFKSNSFATPRIYLEKNDHFFAGRKV